MLIIFYIHLKITIMKKLEDFSYIVPCYSSYEGSHGCNVKYRVIPSLSLRSTDFIKSIPALRHSSGCSSIETIGSTRFFDIVKHSVYDYFGSAYDFEFTDLVKTLYDFPVNFDYFELRFLNHDDIRQFDVVITPFCYVDDDALPNDVQL